MGLYGLLQAPVFADQLKLALGRSDQVQLARRRPGRGRDSWVGVENVNYRLISTFYRVYEILKSLMLFSL